MPFPFCFRQFYLFSFFYFHWWNFFPSVRIKRNSACGRFFPYIMGFQGNVTSDSIIFPCLPHTGISVIPACKLIIFLRAGRKHNGIANLCGNVPSFHLSTIRVKDNSGFCFLPCGIIGSVLPGRIMLLPCTPRKNSQLFVLIPALKTVSLSGSVREGNVCAGNGLLTFRLPRAAIINVGHGNRRCRLPLCIKVKVICQTDLLSGRIAGT